MGSEPTPIEHLSAVTLVTADMASAVRFYEALGFELRYGGDEDAFSSFRVGSGFLNLQLGDPPPVSETATGVWGRVIFWVDDVDAMHQRAVAAGCTPLTSPADAAWGERYFHVRDPDGHELSFARPLDGVAP